jgi:asparagine synthase (glutamine-hydrolysing)
MCGICGAITWGEDNPAALVRRMTPTMVHRGPDDEGYFEAGRLALGMRRLSIIDIERGHQPIFNEDGSVAVLLNGEIYNFRELKDHLWDRGHTFSTRSDSEVVAHAYEEWGADCVHHLQGMFALAVFDHRYRYGGEEGTLFLARDRFGIKPLYYHQDGNSQFVFASEVRTLLASGAVPKRVSRSALESFLLFGSVSEPETLVDGVFSLPPGHCLTIRLGDEGTASSPECYWSVGHAAATNGHGNPDAKQATRAVRELLEASVSRHLIADVPVGVFLSSGIDSTSLAALASRAVGGVHTFTVGFPEQEFSETKLAERTAIQLGTDHRELLLDSNDLLARLPNAVASLDQPSIDGVNTYFVSSAARQAGLKVALSGLGGDEVFGGYSSFRRTPHYQKIASLGGRIPDGLRSAMTAAFSGASEGIAPGDAARKIAALWNQPESLPDPYFFSRALFTPTQVRALLAAESAGLGEFRWWNWLSESAQQARKLDAFTAVSCMETQSYLVNTLLRDTDSMSMAHSLEVRVPFLDHELVEFVARLPESLKLRKGVPKSLLIAALEDLLPKEVVNQTKRGFTFPWSTWLKGPLRRTVEKGLDEFSGPLEAALKVDQVRDIWHSYLDGHTSWSRPWSLFVLNEWAKRNL